MSAWSVLAKGGFSSGGRSGFSSGGFSSRSSTRIGSRTSRTGGFSSTRPRARVSTSRLGPTSRSGTTIVTSRPTYRVYGGHTYVFHSGGWGYGYYGPHVYIDSWYGYPLYYGNPGHWSGWDWAWAPLVAVAIVAAVFVGAALLVRWFAE